MKTYQVNDNAFIPTYLNVAQILCLLADPTFLFAELGRGSGKTTHILAPRIDRVQNSMHGAPLVLAAATYKSIVDNILPGLMEYFCENYERGVYFEIGKQPPIHFAPCNTYIESWKHTISFCSGSVIQFVSCDRPESMLGKNTPHLFCDEMLRIPEDKFVERIIPALRADRSKYGHSPYFMGITGISSTPNFETDEDWWTKYESNMNKELIACIQEIAYNISIRQVDLINAKDNLNFPLVKKHEAFIKRWQARLDEYRRGQTFYIRASSFSNLKILGIDYIENQVKSIKNEDALNTSIFSVRKHRVRDLFFGKFGKEHLFDDSYKYDGIDSLGLEDIKFTCRNLKHYSATQPIIAGYDPGPFSSIVFAQRIDNEFRVIKNFYKIHPEQQPEMAEDIDKFFSGHKNKEIFLHYDRAANQHDPRWRDFYPVTGDLNDTDAIMLKTELEKRGWHVTLMSWGQGIIRHSQHYRLLSRLFGKEEEGRAKILIDKNECEELVSSIYHSPIRRSEGFVQLDKSSEKILDYKEQAMYSTQIATAFMYMLWGEFKQYLPSSDTPGTFTGGGSTYIA